MAVQTHSRLSCLADIHTLLLPFTHSNRLSAFCHLGCVLCNVQTRQCLFFCSLKVLLYFSEKASHKLTDRNINQSQTSDGLKNTWTLGPVPAFICWVIHKYTQTMFHRMLHHSPQSLLRHPLLFWEAHFLLLWRQLPSIISVLLFYLTCWFTRIDTQKQKFPWLSRHHTFRTSVKLFKV